MGGRRAVTAAAGWRPSARQAALPLVLLALAPLLGGCDRSALRRPEGPRVTTSTGPATTAGGVVYAAVGASETVGVGATSPSTEGWPRVFARTLPPGSRYHNFGISGATVADALAREVPAALLVKPTLVTVWLNVNDLLSLVSPEAYERQLGSLVHKLRRGGAAKVLVANVPALDRLPALQACLALLKAGACPFPAATSIAEIDAAVAGYNAAIARVAAREGAVLVDLHAALLRTRRDGTEPSVYGPDGFHPSTVGHRLTAAAFAAALEASNGG